MRLKNLLTCSFNYVFADLVFYTDEYLLLTHQWTAKKNDEEEKQIRWTMTMKDSYYRMYRCAFLIDSTFIFSFYAFSFWTNRQVKERNTTGMVFVIYLICRHIIDAYIRLYETKAGWWEKISFQSSCMNYKTMINLSKISSFN